MFGFISLPYEVISNIVARISFDDAFHLGQTCKGLEFLLREERICKSIIKGTIPFLAEVRDVSTPLPAGGYSRVLRRSAKRRHALRSADPFSLAVVGFCDEYIYCKGFLCYTVDDQVRLLDLHKSSQHEIVIGIPDLLTKALARISDHARGIFRVLYCADYMVACLYTSSGVDSTSWLITFNARFSRIIFVKEVDSSEKIFVRLDKQYVYYGTHSEIGVDGYRKWVIYGFDIQTREWFDQKILLPDLVGSEVGSTICFEMHDGFFYALSNQTSFEVEEIDWSSFYHCVRFPLASPSKELVQTKTNGEETWRRQHQEGPIDDRWTNLRLSVDEETNKLRIVEARKEWHLGASRSQRTYYTTPISFPESPQQDEEQGGLEVSMSSTHNSNTFSTSNDEDLIPVSSSPYSALKPHCQNHHTSSLPPETPFKPLLEDSNHPLYIQPQIRLPQFVHHGNDGSTTPTFTLAKSRVRTYHNSCSTFMDLVDDPVPSDWQQKQRLRLRVGGRRLGPPLLKEEGLLMTQDEIKDLNLDVALQTMYKEEEIMFFPNYSDEKYSRGDLEGITNLMNPPTHLGSVEGEADEFGLVYVTGGLRGGPKAIVWVGFDPGVKLEGLKWLEGHTSGFSDEKRMEADAGEKERTVVIDRKGKRRAVGVGERSSTHVEVKIDQGDMSSAAVESPAGQNKARNWAWRERAMYRDIGLGYYLGKPKPAQHTL